MKIRINVTDHELKFPLDPSSLILWNKGDVICYKCYTGTKMMGRNTESAKEK